MFGFFKRKKKSLFLPGDGSSENGDVLVVVHNINFINFWEKQGTIWFNNSSVGKSFSYDCKDAAIEEISRLIDEGV